MDTVKSCPKCTDESAQVVDTRLTDIGWIRRRRQCRFCGTRWTTYEVPEQNAHLLEVLMEELRKGDLKL